MRVHTDTDTDTNTNTSTDTARDADTDTTFNGDATSTQRGDEHKNNNKLREGGRTCDRFTQHADGAQAQAYSQFAASR